jgi:hypothetical protein
VMRPANLLWGRGTANIGLDRHFGNFASGSRVIEHRRPYGSGVRAAGASSGPILCHRSQWTSSRVRLDRSTTHPIAQVKHPVALNHHVRLTEVRRPSDVLGPFPPAVCTALTPYVRAGNGPKWPHLPAAQRAGRPGGNIIPAAHTPYWSLPY